MGGDRYDTYLVAAWVAAAAWRGRGVRRWARLDVARVRRGADRCIAVRHQHLWAPGSRHITLVDAVVDIIAKQVVRAVVLVMARALGARGDIVLEQLVTRAFIRVERPPAVVVRLHIRAEVVRNNRAGLVPQSVDASHITQKAKANVVDEVARGLDIVCDRRPIAPCPTGRDAAIVKARDLIVCDAGVRNSLR